jgi:hypothetical protein
MEKTIETVLTKEDIKSIRESDSVSFVHIRGESYIRLCKEKTVRSFDQEVRLPAEFIFRDYGKPRIENPQENSSCHHLIMFAQSELEREWRTIAEFVKPGDILACVWKRGNNSPNLESVGFHRDELKLVVARQGKDGVKKYSFLVAVQVGPDNTARMIRRA